MLNPETQDAMTRANETLAACDVRKTALLTSIAQMNASSSALSQIRVPELRAELAEVARIRAAAAVDLAAASNSLAQARVQSG